MIVVIVVAVSLPDDIGDDGDLRPGPRFLQAAWQAIDAPWCDDWWLMIDVIVVVVSLRDDIGDDGEAELRNQDMT